MAKPYYESSMKDVLENSRNERRIMLRKILNKRRNERRALRVMYIATGVVAVVLLYGFVRMIVKL